MTHGFHFKEVPKVIIPENYRRRHTGIRTGDNDSTRPRLPSPPLLLIRRVTNEFLISSNQLIKAFLHTFAIQHVISFNKENLFPHGSVNWFFFDRCHEFEKDQIAIFLPEEAYVVEFLCIGGGEVFE